MPKKAHQRERGEVVICQEGGGPGGERKVEGAPVEGFEGIKRGRETEEGGRQWWRW
jgi:hypothetical protein